MLLIFFRYLDSSSFLDRITHLIGLLVPLVTGGCDSGDLFSSKEPDQGCQKVSRTLLFPSASENRSLSSQVSSQGCSRVFIVKGSI